MSRADPIVVLHDLATVVICDPTIGVCRDPLCDHSLCLAIQWAEGLVGPLDLAWEHRQGEPVSEVLKARIRGRVRFNHYLAGELWYRCDDGFMFPVRVPEDTGTARFLADDKALLFMRWIRRYMAELEQAMAESTGAPPGTDKDSAADTTTEPTVPRVRHPDTECGYATTRCGVDCPHCPPGRT